MQRRHVPFTDLFVHAGLFLALSAGFGVAVPLAASLGLALDVGGWWPVLVQIHGHAQVFGWLGLFIMGVSLYFLPRLAGAPLRWPGAARAAAGLVAGGILARAGGQLLLFGGAAAGRVALLAGSVAEALGVAVYAALVIGILVDADPARRPIRALRVCLASALFGWAASTAVITWQTAAAARHLGLLDPRWSRFGLDLFAGLILLPVAFAFSVRTFPLYLRLPAVRWSVDALVGVYLAGVAAQTVAATAALREVAVDLDLAGAVGGMVKGLAILGFVWRLDLLTRRRPAWIVERAGEPPETPRLHPRPRPHLPDYGEFGRFEWHLYAAYAFLVLGGALEVHGGLGALSGRWTPVAADALRHVYLLGFGTLLLLGMAPRMLPGFWGLRRPASARLVDLSFGLGLGAAVLRLWPALVPAAWGEAGLRAAFGLSGLLGWLAVAALAANLWWTRWQPREAVADGTQAGDP